MDQFTPGRVYIRKSNRGLVLDPRALTKTIVNLVIGNNAEGINELVDTFGVTKSEEQRAYLLVFNSLFEAIRVLLTDNYQEKLNEIPSIGASIKGIRVESENILEEFDFFIDQDFFVNPRSFIFLRKFKPYLDQWLKEALGFSSEEAYKFTKDLYKVFWNCVLIKIGNDSANYFPLIKKTYISKEESSFLNLGNKREYYDKLASYFHEPVFNNYNTKLSDIYILQSFETKYTYIEGRYKKEILKSFPIIDFLVNNWLKGVDPTPEHNKTISLIGGKISVLLGHPGQGKTSICYALLNIIVNDLTDTRDIIFLKLRDVKEPIEFLKHPEKMILAHFKENDLQFKLDNSIVILDGLDELYMHSGISRKEISNFFLQARKRS